MVVDKKLIGRVEKVSFPELDFSGVHARIDTGARTSAIWASRILEENNKLAVVFWGPGHPAYTGAAVRFGSYDAIRVATSTGHIQERYRVKLLVKLAGRKIRAGFTLADRSTQVYPVLVGRNVLRGKFVVDVKQGHAQYDKERERARELGNLPRTEGEI